LNQPLQELRSVLSGYTGRRLGAVTKITSEFLSIRSAGNTFTVPYRIGYRKGQRVVLDEYNQLAGKAPTAGTIPIYVI
jgi:hypothetical protein